MGFSRGTIFGEQGKWSQFIDGNETQKIDRVLDGSTRSDKRPKLAHRDILGRRAHLVAGRQSGRRLRRITPPGLWTQGLG
jgi:hypothetical protein